MKKYVIIPESQITNIDFTKVLETSEHTLRPSLDGSLTFVKFEGATPDFLEGFDQYSHSEMLTILAGPDWSTPP